MEQFFKKKSQKFLIMSHMLVLACNPTHLEQGNSFSAQGQSRVPRKILYQKQKQEWKNKNSKI